MSDPSNPAETWVELALTQVLFGMTAHAGFTRCPTCGIPYLSVKAGNATISGHRCAQPKTIVELGPDAQLGRHLGAIASTSSTREDDTGFSDGKL